LQTRDLSRHPPRHYRYAPEKETTFTSTGASGSTLYLAVFCQKEEMTMSDEKKLVVVVTNGFNDERASVAWSVANGGVASGFKVTMFLVSSGVDWVRRKAADVARLNPLDPPFKDMIQNVLDAGGAIMVCPPCAKVRGYDQADFIDGVQLAGSVAMLGVVSEGAHTLTF
jgi:predicted peroxiredoxin